MAPDAGPVTSGRPRELAAGTGGACADQPGEGAASRDFDGWRNSTSTSASNITTTTTTTTNNNNNANNGAGLLVIDRRRNESSLSSISRSAHPQPGAELAFESEPAPSNRLIGGAGAASSGTKRSTSAGNNNINQNCADEPEKLPLEALEPEPASLVGVMRAAAGEPSESAPVTSAASHSHSRSRKRSQRQDHNQRQINAGAALAGTETTHVLTSLFAHIDRVKLELDQLISGSNSSKATTATTATTTTTNPVSASNDKQLAGEAYKRATRAPEVMIETSNNNMAQLTANEYLVLQRQHSTGYSSRSDADTLSSSSSSSSQDSERCSTSTLSTGELAQVPANGPMGSNEHELDSMALGGGCRDRSASLIETLHQLSRRRDELRLMDCQLYELMLDCWHQLEPSDKNNWLSAAATHQQQHQNESQQINASLKIAWQDTLSGRSPANKRKDCDHDDAMDLSALANNGNNKVTPNLSTICNGQPPTASLNPKKMRLLVGTHKYHDQDSFVAITNELLSERQTTVDEPMDCHSSVNRAAKIGDQKCTNTQTATNSNNPNQTNEDNTNMETIMNLAPDNAGELFGAPPLQTTTTTTEPTMTQAHQRPPTQAPAPIGYFAANYQEALLNNWQQHFAIIQAAGFMGQHQPQPIRVAGQSASPLASTGQCGPLQLVQELAGSRVGQQPGDGLVQEAATSGLQGLRKEYLNLNQHQHQQAALLGHHHHHNQPLISPQQQQTHPAGGHLLALSGRQQAPLDQFGHHNHNQHQHQHQQQQQHHHQQQQQPHELDRRLVSFEDATPSAKVGGARSGPAAARTSKLMMQQAPGANNKLGGCNTLELVRAAIGSEHPQLAPIVHKMAFGCHVCGSGFEDRHRLQQHLSIHLNLEPSWFEEKTIKETMAQYESRRGDYLCTRCQLRYETTAEFDRHMQLHGERPHHCELCQQDNKPVSFRYFRQLLTHLRSHCFLYSCRFAPDCKQTANRKDYLKLHILKHHLNNKLPEQYTICCH